VTHLVSLKFRLIVGEVPTKGLSRIIFLTASLTINKKRNGMYAIYILKEYQRKGIGKQLIQGLIKESMSSFLVWVLADNPSRRFYEKLGGKKIGTESITIGGVDLDEVAYGLDSKETLTLN
jgi:GNAT superfamily N-acetyltransferase